MDPLLLLTCSQSTPVPHPSLAPWPLHLSLTIYGQVSSSFFVHCNPIGLYPCPFTLMFHYWSLCSFFPPAPFSDWLLLLAPPLLPIHKPGPSNHLCLCLCVPSVWGWSKLHWSSTQRPFLLSIVWQAICGLCVSYLWCVCVSCEWLLCVCPNTFFTETLQEGCGESP